MKIYTHSDFLCCLPVIKEMVGIGNVVTYGSRLARHLLICPVHLLEILLGVLSFPVYPNWASKAINKLDVRVNSIVFSIYGVGIGLFKIIPISYPYYYSEWTHPIQSLPPYQQTLVNPFYRKMNYAIGACENLQSQLDTYREANGTTRTAKQIVVDFISELQTNYPSLYTNSQGETLNSIFNKLTTSPNQTVKGKEIYLIGSLALKYSKEHQSRIRNAVCTSVADFARALFAAMKKDFSSSWDSLSIERNWTDVRTGQSYAASFE